MIVIIGTIAYAMTYYKNHSAR